jgi:nitroreductase
MDFHSFASQHRSIRKYKTDPVPEEILQRILASALRASSSGNMQTYSMIVTQDPAIKQALYKPHFEQPMVLQAPLVVTFCSDFHRMRRWLELSGAEDNFDNFMSFLIGAIDAVLASQNAALAAEAEGLGICYMGTTLASSREIGEILKCPANVVPVTGFVLGYPDENPAPRDRLPLAGMVHRNTYRAESDDDIRRIYHDREVAGWNRYMTFPELKAMVEKAGVKNLAQIYTTVKYTKPSHIEYSKRLLDYLHSQEFMNHEPT